MILRPPLVDEPPSPVSPELAPRGSGYSCVASRSAATTPLTVPRRCARAAATIQRSASPSRSIVATTGARPSPPTTLAAVPPSRRSPGRLARRTRGPRGRGTGRTSNAPRHLGGVLQLRDPLGAAGAGCRAPARSTSTPRGPAVLAREARLAAGPQPRPRRCATATPARAREQDREHDEGSATKAASSPAADAERAVRRPARARGSPCGFSHALNLHRSAHLSGPLDGFPVLGAVVRCRARAARPNADSAGASSGRIAGLARQHDPPPSRPRHHARQARGAPAGRRPTRAARARRERPDLLERA